MARASEKRQREEDILDTAQHLIETDGFANMKMDYLAKLVGISKPTLYQYFKSKEEIALEVFIRAFKETEEFLDKPLKEPAIERIKGLLRWWITRRFHTGSLVTALGPETVWRMMCTNPDVEARKARIYTQLAKLVEKAKTQGDIDRSLPTVIVVHSMLYVHLLLRERPVDQQLEYLSDLEPTINHLTRVFLYGVASADSRPQL